MPFLCHNEVHKYIQHLFELEGVPQSHAELMWDVLYAYWREGLSDAVITFAETLSDFPLLMDESGPFLFDVEGFFFDMYPYVDLASPLFVANCSTAPMADLGANLTEMQV